MEHHSIPTHCPPPNLALHYPKFASMVFLSQRSDHVTKALHLNCEIHNCCFLKVFAYWPVFFSSWSLCFRVVRYNNPLLSIGLLILKV
jgi:hypothetical protein